MEAEAVRLSNSLICEDRFQVSRLTAINLRRLKLIKICGDVKGLKELKFINTVKISSLNPGITDNYNKFIRLF